jgi:hypothetical protein
MNDKLNLEHEIPHFGKPMLGDALSSLVQKMETLISEEEKYNPKQLDECSWNYQVGVLITANEAKLLLKMLDEMNTQHP